MNQRFELFAKEKRERELRHVSMCPVFHFAATRKNATKMNNNKSRKTRYKQKERRTRYAYKFMKNNIYKNRNTIESILFLNIIIIIL